MHFVGICFGDLYESHLEYYDENLDVEPYLQYTKDEAIEECKIDQQKMYEHAMNYQDDPNYKEILKLGPVISNEQAWEIAKDWGYEVREDGLYSTYNPDSKWDWYIIGGRWDGYLPLKERNNNEIVYTNQAYYDEIDWNYMFENNRIPYCFLNLDGNWYDKDDFINIDFDSRFKEYINEIKDINCLVTVIDYHI